MEQMTWEKDGYFYEWTFYPDGLTRCIVSTVTDSGQAKYLESHGYARLNKGDVYDRSLGMRIAHSRAIQRLEKKLLRHWIRSVESVEQ